MITIERVQLCEQHTLHLSKPFEELSRSTPQWEQHYTELLHHLAYTQMVIERYVAEHPRHERSAAEIQIAALTPTFQRLKPVCSIYAAERLRAAGTG